MDSVVTSIIEKFKTRAEFGQKKYGTNLDRTDLSFLNWLNHAQEELMDGILYLEKMRQLANQSSTGSDHTSHCSCGSRSTLSESIVRVVDGAKDESENSPSK